VSSAATTRSSFATKSCGSQRQVSQVRCQSARH
jgi:hypothetical protein